ncbi:MAG: DUF6491 family protein [Hyphomonas sp.]|uniref:DUF6491 family protein n=1 Tax=Hyphomonas sp. TaxID=87 RepID=UPI0035278760
MRLSLTLAAACVALAGCTSTAAAGDKPSNARGVEKFADDPRLGEEVKQLCFASAIDSFGNTTRDTLTVREGGDHYLITVFPGCTNLDVAQSVALESRTSCLSAGDHIVVSDSMMPSVHDRQDPFAFQRCTVNGIYKWDPKAEKAPAGEETPADEES